MARKRRSSGGGGGGGDWLNTYADMVTLLLTFFILLFSMSSLDAAKFNMLVAAFASDSDSSDKIIIRGETTGDSMNAANQAGEELDPDNLEDIYRIIQQAIADANKQDSVNVSLGDDYVFIQFMDDMLFEPNRAVLKPQDQTLLRVIGEAIKRVENNTAAINIVGHTAAIPDQPDYAVSDRLLSTERANAVLMYFEDEVRINGQILFATGYGKWMPLPDADNNTEEGRSRNRRVEILISSENNSLSEQLGNVYENLVELDSAT